MNERKRQQVARRVSVTAAGYAVVRRHIEDERVQEMLDGLCDEHVGWIRAVGKFTEQWDDLVLKTLSDMERAGLA